MVIRRKQDGLEKESQFLLELFDHHYELFEAILNDIIMLSVSLIEENVDDMYCNGKSFENNNITLIIHLEIIKSKSSDILKRDFVVKISLGVLENYILADRTADCIEQVFLYNSPVEFLTVDTETLYKEKLAKRTPIHVKTFVRKILD